MSFKESDDSLAELLTLTCEVDERGTIKWRNSAGELHRIHGPAVIFYHGEKQWHQHGHLHREDGPALTDPYGTEYWYLHGVRLSETEWRISTKGARNVTSTGR